MADFKAVKFDIDEVVEVVLTFDQPRSQFSEKYQKTSYWYGIKELITGENGFNATEKLHSTIQSLGLKTNDVAKIQKVNNGTITFFKVNETQQVSNNDTTTNTTGGDILVQDIKPEVPIEARLNLLEERIDELMNWKRDLTETAKGQDIKESEDDVPF